MVKRKNRPLSEGTESVKRAPNYTPEELKTLVDGVTSKYKILFGDFSNEITAEKRSATWATIAATVSAASGNFRDSESVALKFTHWKSETKKKAARLYQARKRTGGGELDETDLSQVEEVFMSTYSLTESEKRLIKTIGVIAATGVLGGMEVLSTSVDNIVASSSVTNNISIAHKSDVTTTCNNSGKLSPSVGPSNLQPASLKSRKKRKNVDADLDFVSKRIVEAEEIQNGHLKSINKTLKELLEVEKQKLYLKKCKLSGSIPQQQFLEHNTSEED